MKQLNNYHKACEELKNAFLKDLYPGHPEYYDDEFWIGGSVGEVLVWGDWFVHMSTIADYYLNDFTPDEFFNWYDQWIEEGQSVNMRNFKKLNNLNPLNHE